MLEILKQIRDNRMRTHFCKQVQAAICCQDIKCENCIFNSDKQLQREINVRTNT